MNTTNKAEAARALDQAEPVQDIGAPEAHEKPGDAQPSERDLRLARSALHPLTDYGNGLRLLEHFGENILFVPRLGWFRWDGRKWQADEDAFLVRCDAQEVADLILAEIPHIALEDWERKALESWFLVSREYRELQARKDRGESLGDEEIARFKALGAIQAKAAPVLKTLSDKKSEHKRHAKSSGNSGRIGNMIMEASARRRFSIDDLNSDPLLINCETGILQMQQKAPKGPWVVVPGPHDRKALATKMMRAGYDPDAPRPVFDDFLYQIMPDPELRDFLQVWFGYTITGLTSEQKLAFLYGSGRNGKSTLVDLVAKIMEDYGTTLPIETLTGSDQRKGSDATPDMVRLPGARLVRASEPERGTKMKEALIKALTGGEPFPIRRLYQEAIEIQPEFKLVISGNHRPEIRGADDGIWRRILLVPFETQIAQADVDPLLPQKLWAERDGVFAWLVEGALRYLNEGLKVPTVIDLATTQYRADSEPLRTFLQEECEITGNPNDYEFSRDLGDAFNVSLLASGGSIWAAREVQKQLKTYAENLKGPNGGQFKYKKRSDAGYFGLKIGQAAKDRLEQYAGQVPRK